MDMFLETASQYIDACNHSLTRTCGADNTVVMCTLCFKSGDHTGHETLLNYSSGMGGCCDCGDSEAWRHDANKCSRHEPKESPSRITIPPVSRI